ncbi:MAG: GntR family transcriptional regulator [Rhodobacterales bacterium 32-67-9]|nr:MAG: GntR family transcriptional regulator [Rhodobacterales bacterium 32-67-9]
MNVAETDQSLLAERAYDALIGALQSGQPASGAFLSMPALVAQLGLPIAAVRDAVKRAEAQGLVSILPKRGVLVMDAGPETTRECLNLRAMFDVEGVRRLVSAGGALPLAELRAAHEGILQAARSGGAPNLPERAMLTDLMLHDAMATGLGSGLAAALYAQNRHRVAIIQNTRPFLRDRIVSAMEEHLAIIDAIVAGDADAAAAAIRTHLDATLRWWGVAA